MPHGEIKNCRNGVPVSSGKKSTSSGEGPVRACRCGGRPILVKGMKPTGLGGIPGRRNITLPSTPPPTGWLKTTPPPNPGPKPKAEANKNWFQRATDSFVSTPGGFKEKLMGAAFGAMGMDNSRGACATLGGGFFVSAEGSACIVMTKKPDGTVDFGWTRSIGVGGAGFGFSGDISMLRSNADDIGQFAGYGRDIGASVFSGVGGTINHEHAIGTYNSQGEQVRTLEMGIGVGLEYEGYAGVNQTWSGTWFTR